MKKHKRVGLYLRVSTDEQTVENQKRELAAVARRSGWRIVATFTDNGISGSHGRDKRPGLDNLMKAATRREFDLVAAWSVDRLGRSLQHLTALLNDLHSLGLDLYLHQQSLDTTTPSGRAMFGMLSVFAEFERAIIRERVMAGLKRARERGRVGGRPKVRPAIERKVHELRERGFGMIKIGKQLGIGTSAVQRILREAA